MGCLALGWSWLGVENKEYGMQEQGEIHSLPSGNWEVLLEATKMDYMCVCVYKDFIY